MTAAATRTISKKVFCDTFGVSPKQVDRFCEQDMPHERKARGQLAIPMPAAWTWYRDYLVEKGRKQAAPTTFDEGKRRKLAAEAELAELELAKARDELMTVSDYHSAYSDACVRVDAKLQSLSHRIAAAVLGATTIQEAKARIDPLIEEAREELRRAEDVPVDDDDNPDDKKKAA